MNAPAPRKLPPYGILAEFATPADLIKAIEKTREAGYRRIDAYTPFPSEEVAEALGFHHTRLTMIVLIGGIVGGLTGFFMQVYYAMVVYPYDVGGRPNFSWPMFIPVTFELTVLGAALSAVFGMLALNGLPMPYHPLFNVERFALASRDRFFLAIEARDPKFQLSETRDFLRTLGPTEVTDVERWLPRRTVLASGGVYPRRKPAADIDQVAVAFPVGINPAARRCIVAISILVALVGCRQKMATQPAYRPLRATAFFRDGLTARPQVPGPIARGDLDSAAAPARRRGPPGRSPAWSARSLSSDCRSSPSSRTPRRRPGRSRKNSSSAARSVSTSIAQCAMTAPAAAAA